MGSPCLKSYKKFAKFMPIIRKLTRYGNSCLVTMPPEIKKYLGVNRGDYLVWSVGKDNRVFLDKLTAKQYPGYFIPGSGSISHAK